MPLARIPALKEGAVHGDPALPAAIYTLHANQAGCFVPYHWHHEFELSYVHAGNFVLETDFASVTMQEGDISFLAPAHLHKALLPPGGTCRVTFIVFHADLLYDARRESRPLRELASGILLPQLHFSAASPVGTALKSDVEGLCRLLRERPNFHEIGTRAALLSFCHTLLSEGAYTKAEKGMDTGGKRLGQERFKKLAAYIEAHRADHLTLSALAEEAGLSRQHLCRFFKEMSGMSPIEYINCLRIDGASRDLLETDLTITEIAGRSGFDNLSYFNRQFRRQKGCTPSAYRSRQGYLK